MADTCKPCKDVAPFEFATCKVPPCSNVAPEGELVLSASEQKLFDSVANEVVAIAGTDIMYYELDIPNSKRDPLYDEPVERAWKGPYALKGYVDAPIGVPESREEGFRTTWECTVWISREAFEAVKAGSPTEGDVLQFWDNTFWNIDEAAQGEANIPRVGLYFDVIAVDPDGVLFDNPQFVGFKMTVRRKSEFTPERRIVPP